MTMKEAIAHVMEGHDLAPSEAAAVMDEIMNGQATPAQIGGFLTALRMKGETPDEIAAFARVMRDHAISVRPQVSGTLVDTCGTGGDGAQTFNIRYCRCVCCRGSGNTHSKARQPGRKQPVRVG